MMNPEIPYNVHELVVRHKRTPVKCSSTACKLGRQSPRLSLGPFDDLWKLSISNTRTLTLALSHTYTHIYSSIHTYIHTYIHTHFTHSLAHTHLICDNIGRVKIACRSIMRLNHGPFIQGDRCTPWSAQHSRQQHRDDHIAV